MKRVEEQRFEFVLYINKHIICQRYFSIKDFNEDSITSLELKELMDKIVGVNDYPLGIIPNHLKKKSEEYLWKFYNPYNKQTEVPVKNNFEKEDIYDFEIIVDKFVIAQSFFSGNFFPPQVRYQVDIKDLIPQIINEIKETLSKKNYTTKYADVLL